MFTILAINITETRDHTFVEDKIFKITLSESQNVLFDSLNNLIKLTINTKKPYFIEQVLIYAHTIFFKFKITFYIYS